MTAVDRATTALRTLLELLDRGAPAEQLAQVTTSVWAEGASEADREEVEHGLDVALRIRRTLSEHHRREAELAALFDTASDLAGLRDTDAVLHSIVHRARMLLHTDMAYLSLNDPPAGRTYMRVTDGSASALFQQVMLGMGEGLGGLVAHSARPYATSDYASDSRFQHTVPIDTAVLDEGLVAILGVPLRLDRQVLGVLYAADRTSRTFSNDEVALLASLADHAAIALDAARRLEETRAALAELSAAHDTIRAHNEAMRRAEDAHDRLSDLVLRGGDVPDVAAALATLLGGGIILHGPDGAELGRADTDPLPQPVELVARSRLVGRAVNRGDLWVCAVLAGQELLGSCTLVGRVELVEPDRRLFERASVVTALLLLLRQSVAETEDRVRGELVTDLLIAPDRDPAGLVARGKRLGVDLCQPHVVAVAQVERVSRRRLTAAAVPHMPRPSLVGVHADQVVFLVPDENPGALAGRLARELGTSLGCPVTVGAAGPASSPAGLAAAHTEAERCVRALLSLGRVGAGAATADLGFLGLLLGDRTDIDGYVRTALGPVLDYDARRGTDLLGTLRAYFDRGGNLNRTKDELHLHVNTVVQRLDRISALLGEDWREPNRTLEIQVALHLHRLRG
jgi:GAF domain-containing protein/sugar diacid utilization regulator